MRHPYKRRSQSHLARGIVVFGAALIVLSSIGRDLMDSNGRFLQSPLSQLEILLIYSPVIGVVAVLVGVIGMLFHDVQKEHTDCLLGRLEELSNPETLKGDEAPRINQVHR